MLKSLTQSINIAVLAVLLAVSQSAGAQSGQHKAPSFKSGFSSQRSSQSAPSSAPKKPAFGSFGGAGKAPPAPASDQSSRRTGAAPGGFGSFSAGGAAPSKQQSDSALSQRLDRNAAQANALRTLDERRAAKEAASRDTRPVPGYEERGVTAQAPMQAPAPVPQQAPIIVRPDSGIGQVVTGYVLGRMASGGASHGAANPGYNSPIVGTASVGQQAPARSFFGGVLHLFMWLMILSALCWLAWFGVRWWRARRAASKPNYSFERN